MKHKVTAIAFALLLSVGMLGNATANEKFSCDQLDQMAEGLNNLAEIMADVGSIEAGSEADKILDKLIDDLFTVANLEQESGLNGPVQQLDTAWQNQDWESFKDALDGTIGALDGLLERDC
jgi:hypothetical protein